MAIRTILHYPDKRLREVGARVEAITPEIRQLIDDMAETMYAAPGVGLAATQIGVPVAIFVVDTAEEGQPSQLRVFVNPVIVEREGEVTWNEGCLSFPEVHEEIDRAAKIRVRAQDRNGAWFELEAEDLLAVAIQHELEHLEGVLMIDHMGPLKKRIVHRKLQKRADEHASA
jgi:peptide deformylase